MVAIRNRFRDKLEKGLPLAAVILMAAAIWAIFMIAPEEATMGEVQRIFYAHLSSAWVAFLAFALSFVCSIGFLSTRSTSFDRWAAASAEIGVLFCSAVLITGPLWAKPVWGIWWTWDARLTSTFVLWLIYVGYLFVRRFISSAEVKAPLSAVVAIVGFVDVPIVYMAIRWWRTQHPQPVIGGGEGSGLNPAMAKVLILSFLAWLLLAAALCWLRVRIASLEERVGRIKKQT